MGLTAEQWRHLGDCKYDRNGIQYFRITHAAFVACQTNLPDKDIASWLPQLVKIACIRFS